MKGSQVDQAAPPRLTEVVDYFCSGRKDAIWKSHANYAKVTLS